MFKVGDWVRFKPNVDGIYSQRHVLHRVGRAKILTLVNTPYNAYLHLRGANETWTVWIIDVELDTDLIEQLGED